MAADLAAGAPTRHGVFQKRRLLLEQRVGAVGDQGREIRICMMEAIHLNAKIQPFLPWTFFLN